MDIKKYSDTETCTLMYLIIRRNKTPRVEILLLFCRGIASPSFIYGYVRQVVVKAVTKQAREPISV